MFKKIVRFSIRKKLFVVLTTLFLMIGGIYSMLTLPIDAVPDITNNQVQIVTVSPTLAPQEAEKGAGNVVRSATFAVLIILIVFFPILI